MTKELSDLAWSVLPKKFKEEVKRLYKAIREKSVNNSPTERYFDGGYEYAFEKLFGKHNLTSDTEGEEMLMLPRNKVREMYAGAKSTYDLYTKATCINSVESRAIDRNKGRMDVLIDFFGSKCLPDVNEDNFAKSEPKFKVGDKAKFRGQKVLVTDLEEGGYVLIHTPDGSAYGITESDLEPYTESTDNPIPSNSGELNSQEADKQFDTILQDSFSKERRLNIATTIIECLIKSEYYSLSEEYREDNIKEMVKLSLQITDAIMAECEKGGDNENN